MGACGRKARALIRLPLPNPRRKRGSALSRRRRRRRRRGGGGSGGSGSAGSGFSERPRGALRPPLISPRAPEVAGSPQARRPTPTGRPADAPAPICIFSHPPLLWFGECRLKKGGCEAQVANFGALLQSGRPWKSVFGEGGSCSAPIPAPFLGIPWNRAPIFHWISSSSSWRRPALELTPPIRLHLLQMSLPRDLSVTGTWRRGGEKQDALQRN